MARRVATARAGTAADRPAEIAREATAALAAAAARRARRSKAPQRVERGFGVTSMTLARPPPRRGFSH